MRSWWRKKVGTKGKVAINETLMVSASTSIVVWCARLPAVVSDTILMAAGQGLSGSAYPHYRLAACAVFPRQSGYR